MGDLFDSRASDIHRRKTVCLSHLSQKGMLFHSPQKLASFKDQRYLHHSNINFCFLFFLLQFVWKSSLNFHSYTAHTERLSQNCAHKEPSNGNGKIDSTFLMFTTMANEGGTNSRSAVSSTHVASPHKALLSPPSTPTAPNTPLSLSIPSTPPSPWSAIFNIQSTMNCPADKPAIPLRSSHIFQANSEHRMGEISFLPGGRDDIIEPFQLHGVWESDMPMGVDVPQIHPQQEDLCPLLPCYSIDLDDVALNTPTFDVSSELETLTLEEPGEPFVFL